LSLQGEGGSISTLSANCDQVDVAAVTCSVASPAELSTTIVQTDGFTGATLSVTVPGSGCSATFPGTVAITAGQARVLAVEELAPAATQGVAEYLPSGGSVLSSFMCGFVSHYAKNLAEKYAAESPAWQALIKLLVNGTVGLGLLYGTGQLTNPTSVTLMVLNQALSLIDCGPKWKASLPAVSMAALEIINLASPAERYVAAAKFCAKWLVSTASVSIGQKVAGWLTPWKSLGVFSSAASEGAELEAVCLERV
jgi:hypothetical protein